MKQNKLCKNCNTPLKDLYCYKCGQKDRNLLSVKEMFSEFADNVFSFDSRFIITLKYLLLRPGYLTLEYWKGRRSTYLPPIKLYLVLSVLYFFLAINLSEEEANYITNPEEERVPISIRIDESDPQLLNFVVDNFNKGFIILEKKQIGGNELLFSTMPSAMFILMPFMGILFFLLYKKKKLFYSYHLITVLHFHCFVFLIYSIEELIPFIGLLTPLFFLCYSFFMLKRIYQESWIRTSMKLIILFITYGTSVASTAIVIVGGKTLLLGFYS